MKKACILLIVVLLPMVLDAQSFYQRRRNRHFTAFAGTGIATYYGELKRGSFDYLNARPNLEIGVGSYFLDYFQATAKVTFFSLSGADSLSSYESIQERNLSFTSRNMEVLVTGAAYLFPMPSRFYQREKFNGYISLGVGAVWSNPRAKYLGEWYSLRSLQTEFVNYSPVTLTVPIGLGAVYKLDAFFNIIVEGMYRFTFSDYLDDISTQHVDLNQFSDPVAVALSDRRPEIGVNTAAPGSVRGNPDSNDGYFLLNVKLEYFLPITSGRRGKVSFRRRGGRTR